MVISHPDAAMLTVDVFDEDIPDISNEFIAYSSMSVSCLRAGLRNCVLHDEMGRREGDFQFASVLLHVKLEPLEPGEPSPGKQQEKA